MVSKLKVRQHLADLEKKLRTEKQKIEDEMGKFNTQCQTAEMEVVWRQSTQYAKMWARWEELNAVISEVIDMRCDEWLN